MYLFLIFLCQSDFQNLILICFSEFTFKNEILNKNNKTDDLQNDSREATRRTYFLSSKNELHIRIINSKYNCFFIIEKTFQNIANNDETLKQSGVENFNPSFPLKIIK